MSRQLLISDEAFERLCALAARMREDSGQAVTFADVVDDLLAAVAR